MVVAAGLLLAGALGGCGSSPRGSSGPATSVPPAAGASSTAAPSTTARSTTSGGSSVPAGGSTTAPALPLVVCPTSFGITPPPRSVPEPPSIAVSVGDRLAGELAVYTDSRGIMRLLAPRGWECQALYGADGSGGVAVHPAGQALPSGWGAGWRLTPSSTVRAVIGMETSACSGCTQVQACPLFAAAAKDYTNGFGRPCPKGRPAAETTTPLRSGVVAFEDPPGVAGDGVPSGGRNPAHGVMTYYPGNADGSWLETCTLTAADKDLCTATLDYFVASYGTR